jgi:hypothetical protein
MEEYSIMQTQEESQVQGEELQDDFSERMVMGSFKGGTEHREVRAWFYRDTGLGYTQRASGKFGTILENGYTLCSYVLPTSWQMEEACRRIAPQVNVRVPNMSEVYEREHGGEKLGTFLKRVFLEVLDLGGLKEVLPPPEEHLEMLKDFVLERDGVNTEHIPPLVF